MDRRERWISTRNGSRVNIRASGKKSRAIIYKGPHEERGSFFVDSPGDDEGPRELSEEAESGSVQKSPELRHAAKGRNY